MLSKIFGSSAIAGAALLIGTMPVLAHEGAGDMCGGVMDGGSNTVITGDGGILMLGTSAPCPEETAAADETTRGITEVAEVDSAGPLPNDGLVYFSLDSAELDSADAAILDEIVAAVKENGPEKIVIRGYTDTTGEQDYNLALSQERADTVAAALIAAGVPAESVRTMGLGEDDLAVTTEDGVAMRQNRRAAIGSDE